MEYLSVRTSTIRPGAKLLFDVYVFYKDSYLKYREASNTMDQSLLEKFKAKQVKKLFIPAEQEPSYLKFLDEALEELQAKAAPVEARAEFAQNTLQQEAENIDKTLDSQEAYDSSEARIQKVVDFMLSEPKALAGMLAAAGLSVDDSSHGSTVSSLCLGLGAQSKFVGRDELRDLAVAALLHDMALKSLGFNAGSKLAILPNVEKGKYRSHPQKALDQVAGKKFITPRVMRLIADHEEYGDGLGYPNKKRYSKLQIDSQIFNLCDAFDHFSIQVAKPPKVAIDSFIEQMGEHYDLELIEILEKQVKS